jgi:hypothetical protein
MVKYFAMAAVLVAPLMLAGAAEARGPAGCASCSAGVVYSGGYAGGCPGGVCSVPVATSGKYAVSYGAAPMVVSQPAATPVPVVTTAPPAAQRYYTGYAPRRGLFGWRR